MKYEQSTDTAADPARAWTAGGLPAGEAAPGGGDAQPGTGVAAGDARP
jgi:hypothetical protein